MRDCKTQNHMLHRSNGKNLLNLAAVDCSNFSSQQKREKNYLVQHLQTPSIKKSIKILTKGIKSQAYHPIPHLTLQDAVGPSPLTRFEGHALFLKAQKHLH